MVFRSISNEAVAVSRHHLTAEATLDIERVVSRQEVDERSLFTVGALPDDVLVFDNDVAMQIPGNFAISVIVGNRIGRYVASGYLQQVQDMMNIVIVRSGQARGRMRGEEFVVEPGQAVAILAKEADTFDMVSGSSAIGLSLPMAAIAPHIADLHVTTLRLMNDRQNAITLLDSYASALISLRAPLGQKLADTASIHLTDLVTNALDTAAEQVQPVGRDNIRRGRRLAIRADIATNLVRHDLSSDDTARRLGISSRYLRRLLQEEGTSYSDLVRQMRLQRAHQLLSDRQYLARPIGSIAYEVGYNDLSYFNRCFRRQFGMTPSAIRKRTMQRF
jgi:AraC-like DNA-binding protein